MLNAMHRNNRIAQLAFLALIATFIAGNIAVMIWLFRSM
jgi:hypothetical protein